MINHLILLAFGGTLIASVALFLTFMRAARLAAEATRWTGLRYNREFVSAACVGSGSLGLGGVSLIRTIDGMHGRVLGGSCPLGLLISMFLLWGAWTGFHWAATLTRPRWQWRAYVGLLMVWSALFLWETLASR